MSIETLEQELVRQERLLERRIGEARHVASEGKRLSVEVADLQERVVALEEAIGVLNLYADERQTELQGRIESLVTQGLQSIFGPDISFHVVMSQRGKLTTAAFVVRSLVDGGEIETPILEARGGGVAAVAGFLLRTVVMLLRKDVRPVMFLDETFAQLSADYEPAMADVLRELVDKTPLQIILVTHSTAYDDVADRSYRVSLDATSKTQIESLDGG